MKKIFLLAIVLLVSISVIFGQSVAVQAAPAAPTNLIATKINDNRIDLAWQDNSSGETGFHIDTATDPAFSANGTLTITVAPNVTTYSDTTVYAGATFYYRVTSFDTSGDSAPSNVANVYIAPPTQGIPAAPSGLTATAVSAMQVNLAWIDNSTNPSEVGFLIERAKDSGFSSEPASFTVGPNIMIYSDQTVVGGTTYYYRVESFNALGSSTESNLATLTTPGSAPSAPSAPTSLAAVAANSNTINLTWIDTSITETEFRLVRATDSAFTNNVTFTIAVNVTNYTDSSVTESTTYYYCIFAVNAIGSSPASNAATVVTPAGAAVAPSTPTTLAATATSANRVDLTWMDSSTNEAGFRIERDINSTFTSASPVKVEFQVLANVITYVDTTTVASTTYYYRVYAVNTVGISGSSNVVNVTTPASSSGGGGGGGSGSSSTQVSLTGFNASKVLKVDAAGTATDTVRLTATDASVNIDVAAGTNLVDSAGSPLNTITQTVIDTSAYPTSADKVIVMAREFGPDGAKFTPALTITLKYASQSVNGVSENTLQMAFWDGSAWQQLDSTLNTTAKTVSAKVQHFSKFSIIGNAQSGSSQAPPVSPPLTPVEQPANFSISDLKVSPESCEPGDTVIISATVSNSGSRGDKYTVSLSVNGVEKGRKEVTLGGGGRQTVDFSTSQETAGTYTINVNGLLSSFTVDNGVPVPVKEQPTTSSFLTDIGLGSDELKTALIAFGAILLIGLLIIGIAKLGRRY
ncbi:MAG: CARDB domain-containing protein [Chloroflexota bacterium]